jgi:hypothetical protein
VSSGGTTGGTGTDARGDTQARRQETPQGRQARKVSQADQKDKKGGLGAQIDPGNPAGKQETADERRVRKALQAQAEGTEGNDPRDPREQGGNPRGRQETAEERKARKTLQAEEEARRRKKQDDETPAEREARRVERAAKNVVNQAAAADVNDTAQVKNPGGATHRAGAGTTVRPGADGAARGTDGEPRVSSLINTLTFALYYKPANGYLLGFISGQGQCCTSTRSVWHNWTATGFTNY